MYYIEDADLLGSGLCPWQLCAALWKIASETDSFFPDVKIGAARCKDVYCFTFLQGSRDYYGIDIDLTARLKAIAASKEVVIDFRFREKITESYDAREDKADILSVERMVGPEECVLDGISQKVTVYRGR